jgi:hypothetical protein
MLRVLVLRSWKLRCILLLLPVIATPYWAKAKCAAATITLRGDVPGDARLEGKLKLLIEVVSATPGDSRKDVRQEVSFQATHFEAKAWFDTFSSIKNEEHECSRQPRLVLLILSEGGKVLDRKTLEIEKEFQRTPAGDYELKKTVQLGNFAHTEK